jgi:hypothetical protein
MSDWRSRAVLAVFLAVLVALLLFRNGERARDADVRALLERMDQDVTAAKAAADRAAASAGEAKDAARKAWNGLPGSS